MNTVCSQSSCTTGPNAAPMGLSAVSIVAFLAISWLLGGCTMVDDQNLHVATTASDVPLASRAHGGARLDNAGFLGNGTFGTTGEAYFSNYAAATVLLGERYYAASGRWCRHFQLVASGNVEDGVNTSKSEIRSACLDTTGWRLTRRVVVTQINDEAQR